MRQLGSAGWCLVALGFWTTSAAAQPKAPEPPQEEGRYFEFSTATSGDLSTPVDGVMQVLRTGKAPATTTLDVCFPRRPELVSADRLVGTVATGRNAMTLSGRSQVHGLPTTVKLNTRTEKGSTVISGEITYGDQTYTVPETRVDYQTGTRFNATSSSQSGGELAVNEVVVTVPLASIRAVLDTARRLGATVQPNQLVSGCGDLRENKQVIRLVTTARKLSGLADALKRVQGADIVQPQYNVREDGVLLPARLRDTPDDQLVAEFGRVAREALDGDAPVIQARATTGEQVVLVTRDTAVARALGLRETVAVTVTVGPSLDEQKRGSVLYITQVGSRFVDPSPSPLLISQDEFEAHPYTDILSRRFSLGLAQAFAQAVGGEVVQGSGSH